MNRSVILGGGLIGLLLTVGIIILLVRTYTIPSVEKASTAKDQAWNTQKRSEISLIQQQLAFYRQVKGRYPEGLDEMVPEYLNRSPVDPVSGELYVYSTTGSSYKLCFEKEPKGSGQECVESKN